MDKERTMTIADHMLEEYPTIRQVYTYDCGAASVQSVMAYYGNNVREEVIMGELETSKETGTPPQNIIAFFKREGFVVEYGRMSIDRLKEYVDQDYPVIIVIQAYRDDESVQYVNDWDDGHYIVCIGYQDNSIIFEDPSSFNKTFLGNDELNERWHDTTEGKIYDHFGIAVLGKKDKLFSREIVHLD